MKADFEVRLMRNQAREMWRRDYMLMMDEEYEDYGFVDDTDPDDYDYDDLDAILSEEMGSPGEGYWYENTLDELDRIGRAELVLDENDLESIIPGHETDEVLLYYYEKLEGLYRDINKKDETEDEDDNADADFFEDIDDSELTIPRDFTKLKDIKVSDTESGKVKKLKRDLRMESLRRLEQAARTVADFRYLNECYDWLDDNAGRRVRYHEISRSGDDLSFESGAADDSINLPYYMSNVIRRQMLKGDFLDAIYYKPDTIDQLVTTDYIIHFMRAIKPEERELFFAKVLEKLSAKEIAELENVTDRAIRRKWRELEEHLQQRTMGLLIFRSDKDYSFTGDEQRFLETCREEYEILPEP